MIPMSLPDSLLKIHAIKLMHIYILEIQIKKLYNVVRLLGFRRIDYIGKMRV